MILNLYYTIKAETLKVLVGIWALVFVFGLWFSVFNNKIRIN